MFDKLIVSDEQGAEFKGRSRYFMVSTVVVGILFVTAVVFSLYATDIGLGNDEFEISMMLAPVTPEAPEPPKPVQPQNQPQTRRSEVPIRNNNMVRLDENPIVPIAISVTPNTGKARPYGNFKIGPGVESNGIGDPGNINSGGNSTVGSSSSETSDPVAAVENVPTQPPPVIKPKVDVPRPPVSIGVVNGKATSLPKPPYPAAALAVGANGEVTVQVTIDETGKVVSAKAVGGHPLLKREAERAALNARFSPTLLSKVPVKVTGVIVYNFKRS
ncbi:MAG: TonB family protein [Pyrinomonadaceae bacterium]